MTKDCSIPLLLHAFLPKSLKSAPVADRKNTLDGQSWKKTKNAVTSCDLCIRRLAALAVQGGTRHFEQAHLAPCRIVHACGSGRPRSALVRRCSRRRPLARRGCLRLQRCPYGLPKVIWKSKVPAYGNRPLRREINSRLTNKPRFVSTQDHGGSPTGPQGTDSRPAW
jgi:hypothetical protein